MSYGIKGYTLKKSYTKYSYYYKVKSIFYKQKPIVICNVLQLILNYYSFFATVFIRNI